VVDFSNTVIILTSNLGADAMQHEAELGFGAVSKKQVDELTVLHERNETAAHKALENMMRPELINRFDDIIVFESLTKREVGKIFDLMIKDLNDRLIRKGISVVITSSAKKFLIDKGYSTKFGARPLRRVIQDEVEHHIAELLLDDSAGKGSVIEVRSQRGTLAVEVITEEAHSNAAAPAK
jgi:ATP-dependent Clp protease ATP-binding subunit ClpC